MKRLIAILTLFALFPLTGFAAGSTICTADACTTLEVGPFMQGISKACGNQGTCSLTDIEQVFNNVGNWVLGIVAAVVLLAYVVGGFYFLISGAPGMEKMREKGKTALKMSTLGLVIVFVANAGLHAVEQIVTYGTVENGTNYLSCGPGTVNAGESCALNSTCTNDGKCVSKCEQQNATASAVTTGTTTFIVTDTYHAVNFYACVDIRDSATNYGQSENTFVVSGPVAGECYGDDNIQCMQFSTEFN